jgi:hypothetical protein
MTSRHELIFQEKIQLINESEVNLTDSCTNQKQKDQQL